MGPPIHVLAFDWLEVDFIAWRVVFVHNQLHTDIHQELRKWLVITTTSRLMFYFIHIYAGNDGRIWYLGTVNRRGVREVAVMLSFTTNGLMLGP